MTFRFRPPFLQNPAVSLGLAIVGAITPLRALILTLAQILGGITGAALVRPCIGFRRRVGFHSRRSRTPSSSSLTPISDPLFFRTFQDPSRASWISQRSDDSGRRDLDGSRTVLGDVLDQHANAYYLVSLRSSYIRISQMADHLLLLSLRLLAAEKVRLLVQKTTVSSP